MTITYAGIGSRKTPPAIIKIMQQIAFLLARNGFICQTGAAKGADQAFGYGAITGGGQVTLFLPWEGYEKTWIEALNGNVKTIVLDPLYHMDAMQSVHSYHPNAANLTQGAFKLHARNYLILQRTTFVICWTPEGIISGGTGQGLRIALDKNITVHNLGNPETLANFKKDINRRWQELPPNLQ